MREAKCAFRRFLRIVPSHCHRFQLRTNSFIRGTLAIRHEFRTSAPVATFGRAEICCEPLEADLTLESARAVRYSVSIGKKTVGRASRVPV